MWNASVCIFFFSSRRRHTRYIGDWSSDVCSSDLDPARGDFDIARDDRALDVLHGEAARRQRVGLHPYPHRVAPLPEDAGAEIGRASCRERVEIAVVAG